MNTTGAPKGSHMQRSDRTYLLTAVAVLCAVGTLVSCSSDKKTKTAAHGPAASTKAETEGHALHNVHPIGPKLISGAVPEGRIAFDELKAMGVKTIISVDGATPDIAAAEARGMRYVHIPITYAEVTEEENLEIARAVRDLQGPIYIHCHHGKHRSPAAAASVSVSLGDVTHEQALAFMKKAGTADHYTGLYASVREAPVLNAAELDAAPATFPPIRRAEGVVAAMVEIDLAYEHLGEIRTAGWKVPPDHPDLVPASEAGRLADNLRFSGEDPRVKGWGADYMKRLADSIASASALESAIISGASKEDLEPIWKKVAASCKDCHSVYRDKPR